MLESLYLDGYRSLIEKYTDTPENRVAERYERHWALRNYKPLLSRARRNREKEWVRLMQYAYANAPIIRLYYILAAYIEEADVEMVWCDLLSEN